jgi:chemotaxis regulatin CheY-phosphate phosphatase CheZ
MNASREIRIKVLEQLQYLVDKIQREAEKALNLMEKAKQLAEEL